MSETVFSIEEWQAAMLRAETAADKARAMKHLIAAAEERGRLWNEKELETVHGALRLANAEISSLIAKADSAEERGRRKGVEQAADLYEELAGTSDEARHIGMRLHGLAPLAPRDSGKESDHG